MIHLLWTLPILALFTGQIAYVEASRLIRSVSDSCACFQRVSNIYPPFKYEP